MLKLSGAQLGGGIIFNHGRLDIVGETFPAENELPHPYSHYLRRMYYEFSSSSATLFAGEDYAESDR
jgi:hypothetical protein